MNEHRASCTIPKEIMDKIVELRKTDKYCLCSISEIIRQLIAKGIESLDK